MTQTVNKERWDFFFLFSTRKVQSQTILTEDKILITYEHTISKEICQEQVLDIIKVLDKESKFNIENNLDLFKDVSIAIAAMVTS